MLSIKVSVSLFPSHDQEEMALSIFLMILYLEKMFTREMVKMHIEI